MAPEKKKHHKKVKSMKMNTKKISHEYSYDHDVERDEHEPKQHQVKKEGPKHYRNDSESFDVDFSSHLRRFKKDFAVLGKDIKRSCKFIKEQVTKTGNEKISIIQSKYLNNLKRYKRS